MVSRVRPPPTPEYLSLLGGSPSKSSYPAAVAAISSLGVSPRVLLLEDDVALAGEIHSAFRELGCGVEVYAKAPRGSLGSWPITST